MRFTERRSVGLRRFRLHEGKRRKLGGAWERRINCPHCFLSPIVPAIRTKTVVWRQQLENSRIYTFSWSNLSQWFGPT